MVVDRTAAFRVFFLGAAASLWAAAPARAEQSFRRAGVDFNAVRSLEIPAEKSYAVVVTMFFHHGEIRADGKNVVVSARNRALVPMRVLQLGPGDVCRLAFQPIQGQKEYDIFYGGPAPEEPLPPWTSRDGLLLETRRFSPCNLNEFEAVRRAFEAAAPIAADYVAEVSHCWNPISLDQGPFFSHFSGWLRVPATDAYGLITSSQDCSFLLIDGRVVASAPGRHGAVGDVRPGTRKDINLSAGQHKFDYYHAAAGDRAAVMIAAWVPHPMSDKDRPSAFPPDAFGQRYGGTFAHRAREPPLGKAGPRFRGEDRRRSAPAGQSLGDGQRRLPRPLAEGPVDAGQAAVGLRRRPNQHVARSLPHLPPPGNLHRQAFRQARRPDHGDGQPALCGSSHQLPPGQAASTRPIPEDSRNLRAADARRGEPAAVGRRFRGEVLGAGRPPGRRAQKGRGEQRPAHRGGPGGDGETPRRRSSDRGVSAVARHGGSRRASGAGRREGGGNGRRLAEAGGNGRPHGPGSPRRQPRGLRNLAARRGGSRRRRQRPVAKSRPPTSPSTICSSSTPPARSWTPPRRSSAQGRGGAVAVSLARVRGDCCAAAGKGDAARKAYDQAEELVGRLGSNAEQAARRGAYGRSTEDYLKLRYFDRAAAEIHAWQADFPGERIDGYLTLLYARCWSGRQRWAQAIAQAEQLQAVNADSPYVDQLLMLAAACELHRERADRAIATLHALVKDYPGSPLIPAAKAKLAELEPSSPPRGDEKKP